MAEQERPRWLIRNWGWLAALTVIAVIGVLLWGAVQRVRDAAGRLTGL